MAATSVTPAQIRAARALIGKSAEWLARETKLGIATIRRAEAAERPVKMTDANQRLVVATLEAAGVEFINANGGGAGVRLRD